MKKSIISKTKILSLFFLSLFFALSASSLKAESNTYSYTENFTNTTYRDSANTTAIWDTSAGKLEFPFVDDGGNGAMTKVQSLRVNEAVSKKITRATLTADIDMQGAGSGTSGIVIGYEISADGGLHWDDITKNVINKTEHSFDYPGYDLRWRASYSTASIYKNTPPFINKINISYEDQDVLTGSLSISRIYQRTDMFKVKLETDDTEDLLLSSFTVFAQKEVDGVNGYSPVNANDISKIELYDGDVKIKGSAIINNGYVTFSDLSLIIPKNGSKELTVKGEISEGSDVRRYVVYLRQEIDTIGIFIDSSAPDKIIISGVDSGLNSTISVIGEMARGEWFYIADPPTVYPYEFVEDFSTNSYKDTTKTTADWNVGNKIACLPKEEDHYASEAIAQSLKINTTSKMITGAKLIVDQSSTGTTAVLGGLLSQAVIGDRQGSSNNPNNLGRSYSLSADGGVHWMQVIPGREYEFIYPGYDLRWKSYLWTNITNNKNTPVINSVTIFHKTTDTPINFLEISSGPNNPQNSSIEKGSKNINLLEVKFTAASAKDLIISSLSFSGVREGVYWMTEDDIDGVVLYDGDVKLGEAQINDDGKFIFFNLSVIIPENSSKTLMLKGNISDETTSKILRFGLDYTSETFPVTEADSGIKPNVRGHVTGAFFYLISNGTPIKASGDYKIYIINDATKKWVKTAKEFERNYKWEDIQELDSATVDSLPEVSELAQEIQEGAIIKTIGDIDIYIVKYIGNKKFKRLILNPSVFRSYGHLRWEDVIEVEKETVDSFTISDLVRNAKTGRIYRLTANGDSGIKRHFKSISAMQRLGYDLDAVYEINEIDENSYDQGEDLE
ncbi:MAG: hypothetical protein U9P70_04435 [Patescibacteria group bacterium]|nr:hypothetical protein [Patescibacteria group bacterium]